MKSSKKIIKGVTGAMRLPFVVLTPVCVFLAYAVVIFKGAEINYFDFTLVMIGALLCHLTVNMLNEYLDFKSGLDFKTKKTPFSGGSGSLVQTPEAAKYVLVLSIIFAVILSALGLYFVLTVSYLLLPLLAAGMFLIITYTTYITRIPLFCFLAPGTGFGLLMVMGSELILSGSISLAGFLASLIPFFLVNNLLFLNQFPDAEIDKDFGRKHFLTFLPKRKAAVVYGIFLAGPFLTILAGYLLKILPVQSLLVFLMLLLAVPLYKGVMENYDNTKALLPSLGKNVLLNLLMPGVLAVSLIIA